MTAEAANLEINVTANGVDQATVGLEKMAVSSGRAETSFASLANESRLAMSGLSGMSDALGGLIDRAGRLKASVDPWAAAMDRANAEMSETVQLYELGALGAQEYARYTAVLEGRIEAATAAQNGLNMVQARGARAAGLTASETANLGRQFADIGVSAAMGLSPLMILIQQGPQIADVFSTASTRGVGLSGAMRGLAGAMGPLLPILAVVAAAAGVGAAGMAALTHEVNRSAESATELQARLGLTDAQMKKFGNTSITMGDTMGAVWDLIAKGADSIVGPSIDRMMAKFAEWYDAAVAGSVSAIKWVVGGWIGGVAAIREVWRLLPAAIGDVSISAANVVLKAVGDMINGAIGLINGVIDKANQMAAALNMSVRLDRLDPFATPEIRDAVKGSAGNLGTEARKAFDDGMAQGGPLVDGLWAAIQKGAAAKRDARGLARVGDLGAAAAAASGGGSSSSGAEAIAATAAAADSAKNAVAGYTGAIEDLTAALAALDRRGRDAAAALASAFDDVSKSLGNAVRGIDGMLAAYTKLGAREAAIAAQRTQQQKIAQKGSEEWKRAETDASRSSADARINAYSDMAFAAQGFFKEGTDGYKAMQVAEIAFRTIETLNTISAIALKGVDVSTTVAAEGTKATAKGISAYAGALASLPFPFNLAAGAVVLGALAAVGVAISGGSGGTAGISASEQRQKTQGTGSVLGDASAKSESIANSLEIVASNTNRDLEYSNGMLKALRSIDDQIGIVTAALAQSFGAGGMLDSSKLGLGDTASGPSTLQRLFLPLSNLLPGLFGSSTSRTLQDQGVQFGASTLDQIMSGGLSGSAYQDILTTTKKKAFGLTYSEKTKASTQTSALDPDFLRQTQLLIGSLRDGVLAAASTLGVTGAQAVLAAFTVDLGKLSFKDMTGDEIQKALEGVFSKLADDMAGAVLPGLMDLQKVGEGLFETLARVARQYQVVDVTLSSIGKTFGAVGLSSLGARERLIDLFGSLDDFTEQTSFYAENFLTEAERLAPVQNAVTAELARLGLTGLKTRDQFKSVVQGLDVSTAAGAELYAALLSLAPAFAKVTEETNAISTARDALSSSYDRESGALTDTADRFRDFAANLKKYREGLYSGPTAMLSPEAAYQAARASFEQTAALASTGNETALGDLQNVSQAYLDASKAYYASSAGYFTDLAAVRDAVTAAEGSATAQVDVATAQLDQLKALVSGYLTLDQSVLSVRDAVANLTALLGGPSTPAMPSAPAQTSTAQTTAANDNAAAIVEQLAALNDRLDALIAQNGAIATEQIAQIRAQSDILSRQLREQQAS